MDPNATWQQLTKHSARAEWTSFSTACEDLMGWLEDGGFPPDDTPPIDLDMHIQAPAHAWRAYAQLLDAVLFRVRGS